TVAFSGGADTIRNAILSVSVININSSAVTLAGAITLTKTLNIKGGPGLTIDAGGATLSGGGRIVLSGLAANKILGATATATLTNSDLIEGAGQIGAGEMQLVNTAAGRILGDSSIALVIDTGTSTVTNAGTITAVASGGVEIKSAVANTGILGAVGGTLTLDKTVTGAGSARISGGTLDAAGAFNENVAFTGPTGVLELAHAQAYAGQITGFSHAGTTSLDLRDIGFVSSAEATFSGNSSGGVLTVTDGSHTAKIKLLGDFTSASFIASSDGAGGTIVVDPVVHHFVAAVAATPISAGAAPSASPPSDAPATPRLLAHTRA
ncbi:MAG TPA: hypothetical protein VFE13_17660, partial [Caulobacteraceae bacterium]|nr:hypothetical protein [Caulobacteraceae bacterium]